MLSRFVSTQNIGWMDVVQRTKPPLNSTFNPLPQNFCFLAKNHPVFRLFTIRIPFHDSISQKYKSKNKNKLSP